MYGVARANSEIVVTLLADQLIPACASFFVAGRKKPKRLVAVPPATLFAFSINEHLSAPPIISGTFAPLASIDRDHPNPFHR